MYVIYCSDDSNKSNAKKKDLGVDGRIILEWIISAIGWKGR
jgi:hypothetical protein